MAIDTKQLYDFVSFAMNKEQQGYVKASDFEKALDSAQLELVKDRFNNPNTYQPGRPVSRVAYGQSGKVHDDLRLLIKNNTSFITNGATASTPADYLHFLSMYDSFGTYDYVTAEVYHRATVSSLLNTTNLARKLCTIDSGGVAIYPQQQTPHNVAFVYLKRPTKGTLTETVNPTTGAITVATNQAISDMPEQVFNELAWRIMSILGVNIKDQMVLQYAEMQEKE